MKDSIIVPMGKLFGSSKHNKTLKTSHGLKTILDIVNYEKNLNKRSTHTNTSMLVIGSKICLKYK